MLILTTVDVDEYVYGALRAGAAGFLLEGTSPGVLPAGIHTVAVGERLHRAGSAPDHIPVVVPSPDRLCRVVAPAHQVRGLITAGCD